MSQPTFLPGQAVAVNKQGGLVPISEEQYEDFYGNITLTEEQLVKLVLTVKEPSVLKAIRERLTYSEDKVMTLKEYQAIIQETEAAKFRQYVYASSMPASVLWNGALSAQGMSMSSTTHTTAPQQASNALYNQQMNAMNAQALMGNPLINQKELAGIITKEILEDAPKVQAYADSLKEKKSWWQYTKDWFNALYL